MKISVYVLVLLSVMNLAATGLLTRKLSEVEALGVRLSHPASWLTEISSSPQQSAIEPKPDKPEIQAPDPVPDVELKRAADIIPYINRMVPGTGIEGLARTLAEMDEWLFRPEDDEDASRQLEGVADALREKIAKRISIVSKSAVGAANGRSAAEKMAQVQSLLSIYPAPKTDAQRTLLEQSTFEILSAARRVEDIRRLRYNAWAIAQIESGLSGYNSNKKTIGTDEEILVKSCVNSLKVIDPAFLEPAVADLYNYVFGLTRDAVNEASRMKLAKGLTNAATIRKTPLDF